MKNKLFLVLAGMLLAGSIFAIKSPYPTWVPGLITDEVIDVPAGSILIGDSAGKLSVQEAADEGTKLLPYVQGSYDVTVDGAATGTEYDLGVDIPAGAIIVNGFFVPTTQFVDSGAGTVEIGCVADEDLYAYADVTSLGTGVETALIPDLATTTDYVAVTTACDVTVKTSGVVPTAGAFDVFIFYIP